MSPKRQMMSRVADHHDNAPTGHEAQLRFDGLPAGKFRYKDHRFEWTRAEFQAWVEHVAERFGYFAGFAPVGPGDDEVGSPTQMGVFVRGSL